MCEPPQGRDLRGEVTQLMGHLLNGDLWRVGGPARVGHARREMNVGLF